MTDQGGEEDCVEVYLGAKDGVVSAVAVVVAGVSVRAERLRVRTVEVSEAPTLEYRAIEN